MGNTHNLATTKGNFAVDCPNECPLCHCKITIAGPMQQNARPDGRIELVFRCPNRDCGRLFLEFIAVANGTPSHESYSPVNFKFDAIPTTVTSLSATFEPIYREAERALQLGLLQIAGPGFRKAFEFLVKDYAKYLTPNVSTEHDTIDKSFSGDVVKKSITHPKIQDLATRCLWLGNDETHYLRKWQSMDIDDLVMLIQLTLRYIDLEESSKQYIANMPASGPSAAPASVVSSPSSGTGTP